jgi:5-methylcytosine-specific restriction endonuclease McrA
MKYICPLAKTIYIRSRRKCFFIPNKFKKPFSSWCLKQGYFTVAEKAKRGPRSWQIDVLKKKKRMQACRRRFFTGKREYYRETYLKSEHWKTLRAEKSISTPKCERCGHGGTMDVHHKAYHHLYDVSLEDLETLCRRCHNKHHETNVRKIFKRFLKQTNAVMV